MVFMCIVTFKNYCLYERLLWGILGNIEKCINFAGMLFKVHTQKSAPVFPNTHYCNHDRIVLQQSIKFLQVQEISHPNFDVVIYHHSTGLNIF